MFIFIYNVGCAQQRIPRQQKNQKLTIQSIRLVFPNGFDPILKWLVYANVTCHLAMFPEHFVINVNRSNSPNLLFRQEVPPI